MKRIKPIAALVPLGIAAMLTACAEPAADDAGSASDGGGDPASAQSAGNGASQAIAMVQTGWLTVGSDGAVQTTFFDADGRYRDYRNGEAIGSGGWSRRADNRLCLEPDQGLGDCWETGPLASDGTAIATNSDGMQIEIRQVTYLPAQAPGEDGAEDLESGAQ